MTDRINTLEKSLAKALDAKAKVDLLNDLAHELRFYDLDRAISLSQEAIQITEMENGDDQPYRAGKARAMHHLANFSIQRGFYENALNLLIKSLLIYEYLNDREQMAKVISSLGRVYMYMGDYHNALDYHMRALEISQEINAPEIEAISLNNLGYLFTLIGQWERALDYLQHSYELAERLGKTQEQADVLANCCICYLQLSQPQNALNFGSRSLALYRSIGARQGEAEVLNSLGVAHRSLNDPAQAMAHFNMAMKIAQEFGIRLEAARVLRQIGHLQDSQNDNQAALINLSQALIIAEEIHSLLEQMLCHQALAALYKKLGDPASALDHFERYHSINETIFRLDKDERIKRLNASGPPSAASKEIEVYHIKNVALQEEVNERLRAEEALRLTNDKLRAEINQSEQLITDLNAFSHMVAHDLKNPLAGVIGYASLLEIRLKNSNDIQALRYLEIISQTGYRMGRIIDELLLLASVREQHIEAHSLNMEAIVKEALARLEHMIVQYQAEFSLPDSWPVAIGYAPWVEDVWDNYISNAIKYGGMPPRIELGAEQLPDGMLRFWVHDNGSGLSVEDISQLFTAFTRLEETHVEGHGLGLSIVKRIVEKLGGSIAVESTNVPGEGCTFSFTLPASTTPPEDEINAQL